MKPVWTLIVIMMLAIASYVSAQTTVGQIDKYVASVKKITNSAPIIVADTSADDGGRANWKRFASENALDKFRKKSETYSIAYNWKLKGKLAAAHFTDFSQSGDWTQYTYHYFRPDGSVAKVETELRTFYGDWIVVRNYYFDKKGNRIKRTAKYLDLTTRKPKKPEPDMASDNWSGLSVKFYNTTRKLPFIKIIN
jgi:hypothetical protein